MKNILNFLKNISIYVLPFGILNANLFYRRQKIRLFNDIQMLIENDDDLYKLMVSNQFKEMQHSKDFRTLIPRGKIVPEELNVRVVEMESYMYGMQILEPLIDAIDDLDYGEYLHLDTVYVPENDLVMIRLGYDESRFYSKFEIAVNIFVTLQWLVITILLLTR